MIYTIVEQKFPIESICECNCHSGADVTEFCSYCFSFHQRIMFSKNKVRRRQQQQQQQQQRTLIKTSPPQIHHNNKKIAIIILTIMIKVCLIK